MTFSLTFPWPILICSAEFHDPSQNIENVSWPILLLCVSSILINKFSFLLEVIWRTWVALNVYLQVVDIKLNILVVVLCQKLSITELAVVNSFFYFESIFFLKNCCVYLFHSPSICSRNIWWSTQIGGNNSMTHPYSLRLTLAVTLWLVPKHKFLFSWVNLKLIFYKPITNIHKIRI